MLTVRIGVDASAFALDTAVEASECARSANTGERWIACDAGDAAVDPTSNGGSAIVTIGERIDAARRTRERSFRAGDCRWFDDGTFVVAITTLRRRAVIPRWTLTIAHTRHESVYELRRAVTTSTECEQKARDGHHDERGARQPKQDFEGIYKSSPAPPLTPHIALFFRLFIRVLSVFENPPHREPHVAPVSTPLKGQAARSPSRSACAACFGTRCRRRGWAAHR